MRVIKKYGNRRLYDTLKSGYINLDELAAIVRAGEDVQIVDAKSGDDLTREVLLQIVLEQLQGADLLDVHMLQRIIRSVGDDPWHKLLSTQLAAGMQMVSAQIDQVEKLFRVGRPASPPPPAPQAEPQPEPEPEPEPEPPTPSPAPVSSGDDELDALRARLEALEERLKR